MISFQLFLLLLSQINCLKIDTQQNFETILDETVIRSYAGSFESAYHYAHYAGAVYCPYPSLQAWDCSHCKKIGNDTTLESIIEHADYDTRAIITSNHLRKEIVLSFRGSSNIKNWIQNLKFIKVKYEEVPGASVHSGFKSCADGLLPFYGLSIKRLLNQPIYKDYTIVITGHSLGGAIAVLSALNLKKTLNLPWSRFLITTYGQPRIGNPTFASYLNSLPISTTRIVNENDLVPHLPPTLTNFIHQHNEMYINNGKTKLCTTTKMEDPRCSRSRFPLVDSRAHSYAWDIPLGGGSC